MLPRTSSIWQRDSHPTASGKPGAVQADLFGFADSINPDRIATPERVERFAAERLRTIFPFVSEPIPIRARRRLRQFSLFLLSANSNQRAINLIKKGVKAQIKKYGGSL
jgi:hypothetical protein